MCGYNAYDWNTIARFRKRVGTESASFSSIHTFPEVGCSRPAMIRSNVDLPQPEGPTIVTISRSSIASETSCSATLLPYRRLTFSKRMADMPSAIKVAVLEVSFKFEAKFQ